MEISLSVSVGSQLHEILPSENFIRYLVNNQRNMLLWLQGLGSIPAAMGELWCCSLCAKSTSLL